jgi:hypothetical protein
MTQYCDDRAAPINSMCHIETCARCPDTKLRRTTRTEVFCQEYAPRRTQGESKTAVQLVKLWRDLWLFVRDLCRVSSGNIVPYLWLVETVSAELRTCGFNLVSRCAEIFDLHFQPWRDRSRQVASVTIREVLDIWHRCSIYSKPLIRELLQASQVTSAAVRKLCVLRRLPGPQVGATSSELAR